MLFRSEIPKNPTPKLDIEPKKQDIFHVLPDMYPYSVGSSDGAIRSESSITMSSDGFNNSVKNSVP